MSALPLVSIIVVTYNSQIHLAESLDALCALSPEPTHEIIVMDNVSTDDSVAIAETFAARHPQLHVYRSESNRGYAGGVNAALAYAHGPYVAVLNPDMIVPPDGLGPLVAFLEAHPTV